MNRAERLRKKKVDLVVKKSRGLSRDEKQHAVRLAHEAAIDFYRQELDHLTREIESKKKELAMLLT
jgi:hypothetical protein